MAYELFSPPAQPILKRGGFMKNLRSALVALAVLLMATAAHAQTTKVTATIPFNFVAGDSAYPAGEYLFSNDGTVLRVANENVDDAGMILSHACQKVVPPKDTKVVFDQMGGQYFLHQIWVAGNSWGRELPRSQSEIRLAQNHEKSESIIVAANLLK
jgi:hypothetical protein